MFIVLFKLENIFFLFLFLFILGIISLQGCLKDDISSTTPNLNLANNAILLTYLETNGNYINSDEMPSIIDVDEVYNNLADYLIIDVRLKTDYSFGHIPGAINVQNDSLVEFCNSHNIYLYPKVIIVNCAGQSSAYYTCLLRIYGFNNVYSLNFGMALWNKTFSNIWIEQAKDHEIVNHLDGSTLYPSNPNMNLPDIKIDLQNSNKQNSIKDLVSKIIKEGFTPAVFVTLSTPDTIGFNGNGKPILEFYFSGEDISHFFIICVGSIRFYKALFIASVPTGHLPGAYFYFNNDFESTTNIQTIPPQMSIVVYSLSGQVSAFVTAFLRIMGYNAKTLLYGGNTYTYSRLTNEDEVNLFQPYVFLTQNIRNYSYITGTSPN